MPPDRRLARFSLAERLIHWSVALSFLYAALTGIGLWSPRLYWVAAIFGGGATVSAWHPLGGLLFALVFSLMSSRWHRQMRLDADDRLWLRHGHRFILHEEFGVLESGRFNGGQKALYWMQAASAVILVLSGLVLWFPEVMPRGVRLAAVLLHPVAAVASLTGLIVHVYMGTAAIPGALRSMIEGYVSRGWAATHHPKWYREVTRR